MGYEKTLAFLGRVGSGQTEGGGGSLAAYGGGQVRGARPTPPWPEAATRTEQAKRDQDAAIAYAKDFGSSAARPRCRSS